MGYLIIVPGSGITSHGIGMSRFLRDRGLGCTVFVGSGTKPFHAFGIKDQKYGYKYAISEENDPVIAFLAGFMKTWFMKNKCMSTLTGILLKCAFNKSNGLGSNKQESQEGKNPEHSLPSESYSLRSCSVIDNEGRSHSTMLQSSFS